MQVRYNAKGLLLFRTPTLLLMKFDKKMRFRDYIAREYSFHSFELKIQLQD